MLDQSLAATEERKFTPTANTLRHTCCMVLYDPFSFWENQIILAKRQDQLQGAVPKFSCEITPKPPLMKGVTLTIGSSFHVCCPSMHSPTITLYFDHPTAGICEVGI